MPRNVVWTSDTLTPGLATFSTKLDAALGLFMEYNETKVQDYMRTKAPWTDRTGNARQGLFAKAYKHSGAHGIVAYHTMPYGVWLEVKHDGQFAIITPTIQSEGKRIMKDVGKLLTKMASR